jgi:hypothetical protein
LKPPLQSKSVKSKKSLLSTEWQRGAVAYIFINIYGAPEDENDWKGQDCVGPKIKKALGLNIGSCIYPIFRNVIACKTDGVTYTGARSVESLLGRPIALDSVEAQIIVSEDGFGRDSTKLQVNKYRTKEQNLPSYTTSAASTCIRNLKPKVERIGVKSQGSKDVNSAWCKARYNWNTQLLIRFGLIDSVPDLLGVQQPWFDKSKLTAIEMTQVGWFDETHTKCTNGGQKADQTKRHVVRFL